MTQEADVVLANNAAFNARDVDAMLELYAEDAVVVDRRQMGLGQFNGHAELRPYYASIFHAVDALREDLRILAEQDGVIVAHCETWARLPSDRTGPGFTMPYGLVIHLRDGLIARLEVHRD